MKIGIIYFPDKKGKILEFSKEYERGLKERGFQVELIDGSKGEKNLLQYQFVIIGCYTASAFGGKIDLPIINFLKKSTGLLGKHCSCFVDKRIGSFRTLSNLMKLLEKEGVIMFSSEEIKDKNVAYQIATRMSIE